MKASPALFTLAIFAVISLSSCYHNNEPSGRNSNGEFHGKISISGAFALYPLAVQWGEEYKKINPHVTLDIQGGGAGKGMTDVLSGTVDIGMVSRTINLE